jgi:hypothetical protein
MYSTKNLVFNKPPDFLKERLYKVPRYRTREEKEALLIDDDIQDFRLYYDTLCPNSPIEPLNELECVAFIIKARENSVSDIIEYILECRHCKTINDIKISTEDLINLDIEVPDYPNFPIGLFTSLDEILDESISDNLSITEYNHINDIIINNNIKILELDQIFSCRKCSLDNNITVSPITLISKLSLTNIFREIFQLAFYGNKTFHDIEELYPFERSIYTTLTKEQIEKNPMQGLGGLTGK